MRKPNKEPGHMISNTTIITLVATLATISAFQYDERQRLENELATASMLDAARVEAVEKTRQPAQAPKPPSTSQNYSAISGGNLAQQIAKITGNKPKTHHVDTAWAKQTECEKYYHGIHPEEDDEAIQNWCADPATR